MAKKVTTIRVRALPDRIAREDPRGPFIPEDQFVSVRNTPYIQRLLNVHGDIEQEPAKVKLAKAPTAKAEAPAQPPVAPKADNKPEETT